jgi:hypothetical protein
VEREYHTDATTCGDSMICLLHQAVNDKLLNTTVRGVRCGKSLHLTVGRDPLHANNQDSRPHTPLLAG